MQALGEKKRHWEKLRPAKKAARLDKTLVDQQSDRSASNGHSTEVMEAAQALGILNNNLLSRRIDRAKAVRARDRAKAVRARDCAKAVWRVGRWFLELLKGLLWLAFVGPRLVRHQAPGAWQERHEFESRTSSYERP